MCGIAGILNVTRTEPPSLDTLGAMIGAIRHRGPDAFGVFRDASVGLAHARLSIIDLATGDQPMTNEDGTLWLVFNGEIFNYVELRSELETLGHRFRTKSDTEVILHAFEAWGNNCWERFNGQWAVALWNTMTHSLTLCRDRVGVRPIYCHAGGGRLRFASEIKSLFADPGVPRGLDRRGIAQVFTYWASIAPQSVFSGIEEMPPATVRVYDRNGGMKEERYWTPRFPESEPVKVMTFLEASAQLLDHLRRATALRMLRADVPVGSYLSGGLDSSLIARLGRESAHGSFQTFSIRFADAEFDETQFQRSLARTLDSVHNEIVVSRQDIAVAFPDVIRHTERPILRTAPAPLFLLSRAVRQAGIKAVLTGEGADEFIAGYDLFREAKVRAFWANEPSSTVRPQLFDRLYPYLARSPKQARGMALEFWRRGLLDISNPGFSHEPRWSTTSSLKRFFSEDTRRTLAEQPAPDPLAELPEGFRRWEPLARAQYLEITTLLSPYLLSSQGDRMLMAHSVEGRFPFLDADVMAFTDGLPGHYKLAGLEEKQVLKHAAIGLVPDEIRKRKKQPYRAPDASSFIGADAPAYVEEMFDEATVRSIGVFSVEAAKGLYQKCRTRQERSGEAGLFSNTDNMAFVGILSTQLLAHEYLTEPRPSASSVRFTVCVDRINSSGHF